RTGWRQSFRFSEITQAENFGKPDGLKQVIGLAIELSVSASWVSLVRPIRRNVEAILLTKRQQKREVSRKDGMRSIFREGSLPHPLARHVGGIPWRDREVR
ncbi:MAG: hypothetical protein E6848_24605, partial [Bradyrhizobium sp.]|nr:hypothetical protein [Bradyrhizobium sp.]